MLAMIGEFCKWTGAAVILVSLLFFAWIGFWSLWDKIESRIRYISECAVKRLVKKENLNKQFQDDEDGIDGPL